MGTYFTPFSTGQSHFWYIAGKVSDDFYPDSAHPVTLNQLLHRELTDCGYQRIVFYNTTKRFYCYDDASFARMTLKSVPQAAQAEPAAAAPRRRNGGLRRGRWDDQRSGGGQRPAEPAAEAANPGSLSRRARVPVAPQQTGRLHLGRASTDEVLMRMAGMMKETAVSTAIVIDDADNFLKELAAGMIVQWNSLFNDISRLPAACINIMIFVFPDEDMGGITSMEKLTEDVLHLNMLNCIGIPQPNAREICNMLHYFRLTQGLKIRVSELPLIAKEITRCIAKVTQDQNSPNGAAHGIRIKGLYHLLADFARSGQLLRKDNCWQLFREFGLRRLLTAEEQLRALIGMESVKQEIVGSFRGREADPLALLRAEVSRIKPQEPVSAEMGMMHIALTGNPGTGKTTVAKLLGQFFFERGYLRTGHVVEVDRSQLVGQYIGETAVKTRAAILRALGGILFIDEAYSLRQDERDVFGKECIDTLVKAMDEFKNDLIVIVAGYPEQIRTFLTANPGLPSRIRKTIHIPDYEPDEIRRILIRMLSKKHLRLSEELAARMPDFCINWVSRGGENWGNGREAENLSGALGDAVQADSSAEAFTENGETWHTVEERHFPQEYRSLLVSAEDARQSAVASIDAMPGLGAVKERIREIERALNAGHQQEPGHYIFLGPPGTGKTTVARKMGALFREHRLLKHGHLVETDAAGLIAGFQKITRKALNGVLFIDEAYQLMNSGSGNDAVDSLVKFMEDNRDKVCVILAGYEDEMRDMLRRANTGFESRFRYIIRFESYPGEVLFAIFRQMLDQSEYTCTEDFLELAHRALVRSAERESRNPRFGNARWVREQFIPACTRMLDARLAETYGIGNSIPEEERNLLTAADIPAELRHLTRAPLPQPDTRPVTEQINDLVGFEKVKQRLREILALAEFQRTDESGAPPQPIPMNFVLKGNPGVGKTLIANLIGKILFAGGLLRTAKTFKVTRADLVGEFVGQTAPKTRAQIERAMGGVLFIDEAYTLTPADSDRDFGPEAVGELVEAMTAHMGEFSVVAAGYPADMDRFIRSNAGLSGRFEEIVLEDYTPDELAEIFRGMAKKTGYRIAQELNGKLSGFFSAWKQSKSRTETWQNARECENLLRRLQTRWLENQVFDGETDGIRPRLLTEEHFPDDMQSFLRLAHQKTKERVQRTAMEEIDALAGMEELKEHLHSLEKLVRLSRRGLPNLADNLTLHMILTGNPGTGKSTVAALIARAFKEIGALSRGHLVKVTRADLVHPEIGKTSQKTAEKIREAIGGVLFIEEAYMLAPEGVRGDSGKEAIETIMEAMSSMDGTFSVIAAGYPLDMKRFLSANDGLPSRFKNNIFRLPDFSTEQLIRILRSKCENMGAKLSGELSEALPDLIEQIHDDKLKNGEQWANGRVMEELAQQMRDGWVDALAAEDFTEMPEMVFEIRHLPEKYRKWAAAGKFRRENNLTAFEELEALEGFASLKEYLRKLRQQVISARAQDMPEMMQDISLHLVLAGNPGTGKTTAAELIGRIFREIGLLPGGQLIKVTRKDLVGEYLGQTAPKTSRVIERAMGGILFIDEAYMLTSGDAQDSFGQEAVDTILEAMSAKDGKFGVIAAGYPKDMERFIRSNSGLESRFKGKIFLIEDYSNEVLVNIFKSKCKKHSAEASEELLGILPALLDGMRAEYRRKKRDWANGRIMEQLEQDIRTEWASDPQVRQENGRKIALYQRQHLPEQYEKYLQAGQSGQAEEKPEYRVPASALAKPYASFGFPEDLPRCAAGTVLICNEQQDGGGSGSGFLLTQDGYIVTCLHVVRGAESLRVRVSVPGRTDGAISWHTARVIRTDEEFDAALLKIDVMGFPALPIAPDTEEVTIVDSIFLLGYPFGGSLADSYDELALSKFEGTVSSLQMINKRQRIMTNMEAKSGCSGGPVFSKKTGHVIGILPGSATRANGKLVEEINYVLPIRYIRERFLGPDA